MTGADRPAGDEQARDGNGGPVIHDRRRIDPATGQVRHGKHAASRPAGTPGASRPTGQHEANPEAPADKPAGTSRGAGSTQPETPAKPADQSRSPENPAAHGAKAPGAESAGSSGASGAAGPAGSAGPANTAGSSGASDAAAGQAGSAGPDNTELKAQLVERTADLQRLQAEYVNYRKRVDRDRVLVKEQAVAGALTGLLPVLDAIDQAREHGELSGGFKSVADSLQAALGRLGLITYGEKGDTFDPKIHEALTYTYSPDVTEDTCVEILQPGYKVGDKILRAARVAVAAPATGPEGVTIAGDLAEDSATGGGATGNGAQGNGSGPSPDEG